MKNLRIKSLFALFLTLLWFPASSQGQNVDALINLANRHYSAGEWERGLTEAEHALRLARADASNKRQRGWALHTVGLGYQLNREFATARRYHAEAVSLLEQYISDGLEPDLEETEILLSSIFNNFAKLSAQELKFAEAEGMARRALELRSKHVDSFDSGMLPVLNTLIDILADTQREVESLPFLTQVLLINDAEKPNSPETLQVVIRLARLHEDVGDYLEAERMYVRALETRQRFLPPDHANIASSMADLAAFLANQGRLEEAERLFDQSLSIVQRRSGPEGIEVAKLLNDMAAVYGVSKPDLAERHLREALAIYTAHDPEGVARTTVTTNLADFLRAQGRYEEAEELFAKADERYRLVEEGHLRGLFFLARGNLHLALQKWDEAEADIRRGRQILRAAFGSTSAAEFMAASGIVSSYVRRKDWTAAGAELIDLTNIVAQGFRRGNNSLGRPVVGGTSFGARVATQHVGQLAQVLYLEGLDQSDKITGNAMLTFTASQWSNRSVASKAVSSMAVRNVSESGSLSELIRERQDLVLRWRQIDSRRIALFSSDTDNEVHERQRLQKELEEIDTHIRAIDEKLEESFPRFASYANPEPLSIPEAQDLLREDEILISFLVSDGANGDLPDETFIWAVTKSEFRWSAVDVSATALTEKVQALRCGLDSQEWEGISRPARCGRLLGMRARPLLSDPLPFDLGIAHELYGALLGPVEDLIKDKHILIVPSGPLTSLPFQVLVTEQPQSVRPKNFDEYRGVAWLGRRQPLTVLPSVSSLQALRQFAKASTAEKPYLGYGDPVLLGDGGCRTQIASEACTLPGVIAANDPLPPHERSGVRSGSIDRIYRRGAGQEAVTAEVRALCPLPDTSFELRCVAKSLGVPESEIRLGSSSTEADIKGLSEANELENYRVVHFATHGLLAGDTEAMARRQGEPALVMTPPEHPRDADDDGLLTASEVAQLRLDADWVILSACNTAAGDQLGAEALSGLARAFFYAGSRALLVSHWPVYSDAAVQILDKTFAELRQDETMGRSEALRRAMVDLMDDPLQEDNPHPSIWAPFSLVGEGAHKSAYDFSYHGHPER